jgi:NADH pyrophosphatase NudC (nudix superfamily)
MDHVTVLGVLTLGVGYAMVQAGLAKSVLEWRRGNRRCPSCGRQIRTRVCSTCSG